MIDCMQDPNKKMSEVWKQSLIQCLDITIKQSNKQTNKRRKKEIIKQYSVHSFSIPKNCLVSKKYDSDEYSSSSSSLWQPHSVFLLFIIM